MAGRNNRIGYTLDSGNIQSLSDEEIRLILRGADELIACGGRDMLVKILKGSKEQKILEYQLDQCPVYGCFKDRPKEEVTHMVDWTIQEGYLDLEYFGKLPLLVFTDNGWAIERETCAQELFEKLCADVKAGKPDLILHMETKNRQVVFNLLEKVTEQGDASFIPQLKQWQEKEVRKVGERISSVIRSLETEKKLLVLVPGIGYTCERPLLYYTEKLGKQNGYQTLKITFRIQNTDVKNDIRKQEECAREALRQAEEQLAQLNLKGFQRVVFAGKSLGTVVSAGYIEKHAVRADLILLTPVEQTFEYAMPENTAAFMGTKDSWADPETILSLCKERNIPLHMIENANHSLETGNVLNDMENAAKIMKNIDEFLQVKLQ